MWQRFTERARRVVFFAQEEAGRLGENYVSTEHLLLGLIRENDSVAARILERMGVPIERIRSEVEWQLAKGDGRLLQDMQLTPRSKRVIDLAYDEARQLNNNYIGTEHLLLGLIREGEGLAGRVLNKLGATLERARAEVLLLQDAEPGMQAQKEDEPSGKMGLLERVQMVVRQLLEVQPELKQLSDLGLLGALTGGAERVRDEMAGSESESGEAAMRPGNGDLGTLRAIEGRERVEVTVDEAAFVELIAVFGAKDRHGYQEMLASGRLLLLPDGSRAKVLYPWNAHFGTAERRDAAGDRGYFVRILGGDREGMTGWVFRNAFTRTGPDDGPFPPELTPADA